jgi:hypothetical protein
MVDARLATEAEIVEMYFSRNHESRWNAFNPQQNVLAYYSSELLLQPILEAPGSAMLAAFESVETIQPGGTSYEDYIARLARQGPDPAPYDYIHELGWGGQTAHDPGVSGNDYVGAQSRAAGIYIDSCNGGDFSWVPFGAPGSETSRGYVAGDACFGLAARTLVVSAYATMPSHGVQPEPYALWTRIGAARSYGDGYRAQFNLYPYSGMVLLGDGSIKGTSYDWTGGGGTLAWTNPANWADGHVPGEYGDADRVRIDSATVQVTDAPPEVWSIDLRNGADLTISDAGTELWSHTSLIGEDPARNTVHMEPRTNLYLGQGSSGERGTLLNVNLVMEDTTDGVTHLSAERAMDDCSGVSIGTNCQLDAANMRRSVVSLVKGTLNVPNLLWCSSLTLGDGGGTVHAGRLYYTDIAVPTGTLSADGIDSTCTVTVGGQGELVTTGVGAPTVMTGGTATIDEFTARLDATDAVVHITGTASGYDWYLSGTQLTAGPTRAGGYWQMAGATVGTFARLTSSCEAPFALDLKNGSQLTIQNVPVDEPTFRDGLENELAYAGPANDLVAGSTNGTQALYFGDETRIHGAEDAKLALDLSCGLDIASVFTPGGFVASGWDTRETDVTLETVTAGGDEQVLELISNPPPKWGEGPNVVFSDVACDSKLSDLKILAGEGGSSFATVAVVNARDNHPGTGPEAGIYCTVTIGANRPMSFSSAAGILWYYSNQLPTVPDPGGFFLDGVQKSWPDDWTLVIKHAVCTVYGGWNGNGRVEASELAALQTAINQGPYSSLMDGDCSGTLDNDDLNKFLGNYGNNLNGLFLADDSAGGPGAAGAEAAGAGEAVGDDGTEPEPVDLAELASWLELQLSPERTAAFITEASATAAETTDAQVQAELTELLSYLQ